MASWSATAHKRTSRDTCAPLAIVPAGTVVDFVEDVRSNVALRLRHATNTSRHIPRPAID